jgi:CheY-like chemotaxis protein
MSYTVLVVDDNDMNLVLIAKILELEGYQVVSARNGRERLCLACQTWPFWTS